MDQPILRGVNLGGWLLLEKWMHPALFAGTDATDEYSLCKSLGKAAEGHLRMHRDTFITAADFRWLAQHGINAVRIPFGYWIVDADKPFVSSPEHLDHAVALAEEHGLKVVLDLHGLPGSQGPNDHTGRMGYFRWHTARRYIDRSLAVIEQVAQRYAGRKAVVAFSVVNEPEAEIGTKILVPFFAQAYERVRRHMPADEVAFVLSAYPECELPTYHGCLPGRDNVWTDVHLYQNFGDWQKWKLLDYLAYPLERQSRLRPQLQRGPIIVGEWSLGLARPLLEQIAAMPPFRQQLIKRMHGHMLLAMLEEYRGWFFWSYRVDDQPAWCFRAAVNRGWLPEYFGEGEPPRPGKRPRAVAKKHVAAAIGRK